MGGGAWSDIESATSADIVAPTPQSASVPGLGTTLTIVFDEALDATEAGEPAKKQFEVKAGDGAQIKVDSVVVSGTEVKLAVSPTIKQDQTVTVAYSDPTTRDDEKAVQDAAGNDTATFTAQAVTNESEVDPIAPGRPRDLEVDDHATTKEQITIQWQPPADTGGSEITGYLIEMSSDGVNFETLVANHNAMEDNAIVTRYTHAGLAEGDVRHYRVSAINAIDTGEGATVTGTALLPSGRVTVTAEPAAEGDDVWVRVTATTRDNERPPDGFEINIRVATQDDTAHAGRDYEGLDTTVQFTPGNFARLEEGGETRFVARRNHPIRVTDDIEVEENETFTLSATITSQTSDYVLEGESHEITIENDDAWGVAVTADPDVMGEGTDRDVAITARIVTGEGTAPEDDDACVVRFPVTVAPAIGGTATPGADYEGIPTLEEREIAACGASAAWTVRLNTTVDTENDPDETVTFTPELEGTPAIEPQVLSAATVTLREEAGVALGRRSVAIRERSSGGYTVALTGAPTGTVTVRARVKDDPNPGVSVSPEELTFDASNWGTPQTITVSAEEDENEQYETATIRHTVSGGGYDRVAAGSVAVTVIDITDAHETGDVRLGDMIEIDGGAEGRLEMAYNGEWGTMCDDRQFPGNFAPVLACRIAGFATGVLIPPRNDGLMRAPRLMPVHLDDVVCLLGEHGDAERLDQCYHSGTIGVNNCTRAEDAWVQCSGKLADFGDGESPKLGSMPTLRVTDPDGVEPESAAPADATTIDFTVHLAPKASEVVTVEYATRDIPGTGPLDADWHGARATRARAGEDYTATSGTLTFAANEQKKTVRVPIIHDTEEDSFEQFQLVLSDAQRTTSNGTTVAVLITDNIGNGRITNDDPLIATLDGLPPAHGGEPFTATLVFTDTVAADAERLRAALEVTAGTVTHLAPTRGADTTSWQVTIEPDGRADAVVIALPETDDCDDANAICSAELALRLRHGVEATVPAAIDSPAIDGVAQVGSTLTASFATTAPGDVAWQWLRESEAIEDATQAVYVPVAADAGARLRVQARRGTTSGVSPYTRRVWAAPVIPPLGDDEETLLATTVTIGSGSAGLSAAGYGRLAGNAFGAIEDASFEDDGASHTIEQAYVLSDGSVVIETAAALENPGELTLYWDGHKAEGPSATGAGHLLVGRNTQPADESARYWTGEADGVRVGLALRRAPQAVQVTGTSVMTSPGADRVWNEDETVEAEVRFSAPVHIGGLPEARPTLAITLDGTRREAAYTGGTGTSALTFTWTVGTDDEGAKRARIVANGLARNGATLRDAHGRDVDTRFAVAPWVVAQRVLPDESGDRRWTAGESIRAELTFSERVTVTGTGKPTLGARVGDAQVPLTLTYSSGSGSETLVFAALLGQAVSEYTQVAIAPSTLRLAGARLIAPSSRLAAELAHEGTEPTARPDETPTREALTAAFENVPDAHGGAGFTVRLAFSEAFAVPYLTMRDHAFAVTGARVTGARRVDNPHHEADGLEPNRVWELTVVPDEGAGRVTVTLSPSPDCAAATAVCTGDGRALAAPVAVTVPATAAPAREPFEVRLLDVPGEHDATSDIVFEVRFNKRPHEDYSFETMRDSTLAIARGATALTPHVRRLNAPHNDRWQVTVAPGGTEDVTVSVGPFTGCTQTGAVCTAGGEVLSNAVEATILGPPGLSVADARAEEGPGVTVDFAVTLGRASSSTVTVDYATSDGPGEKPATAGEDYTATSGTLTFAAGEKAAHSTKVLM